MDLITCNPHISQNYQNTTNIESAVHVLLSCIRSERDSTPQAPQHTTPQPTATGPSSSRPARPKINGLLHLRQDKRNAVVFFMVLPKVPSHCFLFLLWVIVVLLFLSVCCVFEDRKREREIERERQIYSCNMRRSHSLRCAYVK